MIITPETLAASGSEHAEQAALFCWINKAKWLGFDRANDMSSYIVPLAGEWTGVVVISEFEWIHAIPNGGGRSARQGNLLKLEGVKGGVADICMPAPCGQYAGLYIEMKKANGVPSSVSPDQYAFGRFVTKRGYLWAVCFGWKQASKLLQMYIEHTPVTESDLSPHQLTVLRKVRD